MQLSRLVTSGSKGNGTRGVTAGADCWGLRDILARRDRILQIVVTPESVAENQLHHAATDEMKWSQQVKFVDDLIYQRKNSPFSGDELYRTDASEQNQKPSHKKFRLG